jgi:haloalkane dehalogenase
MHYLDEGAGPALVLSHGNPTWSFYWRDLIKALRKRYRVIVPDHIGCGLSDKPRGWSYGIAAHAANIAELVSGLDLSEITLVTHDWGGPIGFLTATQYPECFSRFVTFNTAVSLEPLPRLLTLLRLPVVGPAVIRGLNGMVRAGLLATAFDGHRLPPAVRAGYLAPYDSWAHRIGVQRFVEDIPLAPSDRSWPIVADVRDRLPEVVGAPAMLLWGGQDFVFDDGFLAEWQRRLPGAEVHYFPDAGHFVFEDAREDCARRIGAFLARHPLAGARSVP